MSRPLRPLARIILFATDASPDANISTPVARSFSVLAPAADPVVTPSAGAYADPITIALSASTSGATIRYHVEASYDLAAWIQTEITSQPSACVPSLSPTPPQHPRAGSSVCG